MCRLLLLLAFLLAVLVHAASPETLLAEGSACFSLLLQVLGEFVSLVVQYHQLILACVIAFTILASLLKN